MDSKIESRGNLFRESTPYTRSELELEFLLQEVLDNPDSVYIDSSTNPEMGNLAIFRINGNDKCADLGRTLEANIFSVDADYPPEFIEDNFEPYDSTSTFMLLVDQGGDKPVAAGVLRIIDCADGNSETISMFNEFYGEKMPVPAELLPPEDGSGLWDILTIVMKHEYRDGINSAWLYHALYLCTQEEGVDNWIANVTPREMRNLRDYIGIPFQEIPGVDEVVDKSSITGKESRYGFYTINVATIRSSTEKQIQNYETNQSDDEEGAFNMLMAKIARIALSGKVK